MNEKALAGRRVGADRATVVLQWLGGGEIAQARGQTGIRFGLRGRNQLFGGFGHCGGFGGH